MLRESEVFAPKNQPVRSLTLVIRLDKVNAGIDSAIVSSRCRRDNQYLLGSIERGSGRI